MSDDNLLISLRSYSPRPGRDPLEDFITEAFAWTLRTHPSLAEELLSAITERERDVSDIEWETQVNVGDGFADMVGWDGHRAFLFEHKTGSEATADQIHRYREAIGAEEVVTILITGNRWNFTGSDQEGVDEPDVHWAWARVYEVFDRWQQKISEDTDRVEDFLALLDHEGLGPRENISESELCAFMVSRDTLDKLATSLKSIGNRTDEWEFAYEHHQDPHGENQPEPRWSQKPIRYGRIALKLYSEPGPNVIFGFIIDPENIGTTLVGSDSVPDLAVYLRLPHDDLSKGQYKEVVESKAYNELRERMQDTGDNRWTEFARGPRDSSFHDYHPIVLQRSLAPVLRGADTSDEEEQATLSAFKDGVEEFLREDELQRLRKKITRFREG